MSKGICARVFRTERLGDCTAGGASGKCDEITVVNCPDGVFEPTDGAPAFRFVRRSAFGSEYVHLEPVQPCPSNRCRMFGGNFAYSSDARFREGAGPAGGYAVPIHDRDEQF